MAERWGSLSVKDHLSTRNLAANLIMFDKLVFPTPGDVEERTRWENKGWQPALLDQRLARLGPRAEAVPWDDERRAAWADFMKEPEFRRDPFGITRQILAGDKHVVAAYQSVGELTRRHVVSETHGRREAMCVVVRTRLLAPVLAADPDEALETALALTRDGEFRLRRRQLYDWQEETVAAGTSLADALHTLDERIEAWDDAVASAGGRTRRRHFYTMLGGACGLAGFFAGEFNAPQAVLSTVGFGLSLATVRPKENRINPLDYLETGSPIAMLHDVRRAFVPPQ